MVDLNKIKERLEAQSKSFSGGGKKKEWPNIFFKPEKPGRYVFRCIAYPHSKDPENEPFAEKYYHFNIPGNYAVYCPEKNDNEKCALCRLVWDNLKSLKGTKDNAMTEWRDRLPQLQVMVPGKQIGIIDEDGAFQATETPEVKFLKFKSSFEKDKDGKSRMSESHKKLYDNFRIDANWLKWDKGCNIELQYEAPKEGQKTKFSTGAMLARGGMVLARNSSQEFESKADFDAFAASVLELEKYDTWIKRTPEEITAILEKWQKFAEEKANKLNADVKAVSKKTDEMVIESSTPQVSIETRPVVSPNATKISKLEAKLASLGLKP